MQLNQGIIFPPQIILFKKKIIQYLIRQMEKTKEKSEEIELMSLKDMWFFSHVYCVSLWWTVFYFIRHNPFDPS